jgi:hypothetical protein
MPQHEGEGQDGKMMREKNAAEPQALDRTTTTLLENRLGTMRRIPGESKQ